MPEPRFQFYEVVRVTAENPELAEIHGETGAVLGRSDPDEESGFGYAVFIDRDEICWNIDEKDLEATGEVKRREDFYDDDTAIRVRVDENGRGWIV